MDRAGKVLDVCIVGLIGIGGGVALAGLIGAAIFFMASAVVLAIVRMID